jgi:hypothetical protein
MPLFGHKTTLQVDLGDLHAEKEHLCSFLQSTLKVPVTPMQQNKLKVASEKLSPQEVQRVVTKFVYHRNLNTTHYASIEGNLVKIHEFETNKKKEKHSRNPTPPQKMAHGF